MRQRLQHVTGRIRGVFLGPVSIRQCRRYVVLHVHRQRNRDCIAIGIRRRHMEVERHRIGAGRRLIERVEKRKGVIRIVVTRRRRQRDRKDRIVGIAEVLVGNQFRMHHIGRIRDRGHEIIQRDAARREGRTIVAAAVRRKGDLLGHAVVGTPVDVEEAGLSLHRREAGQARFIDIQHRRRSNRVRHVIDDRDRDRRRRRVVEGIGHRKGEHVLAWLGRHAIVRRRCRRKRRRQRIGVVTRAIHFQQPVEASDRGADIA